MTARDRLLGFGSEWTVTRGDLIRFLGIHFVILVFHTGGPKEDLWLSEQIGAYLQSLFLPANLGQYGISYNNLTRTMRAFELPFYGNVADPFDLIRKFTDTLNENMENTLVPDSIIIVDA
jgi:hypothetical protein